MRVLLLTPFVTGHFNGMIGVAERLLAGGAEVGWACMGLTDPSAAFTAIASIGATPIRLEWPFPVLLEGKEAEGRSVDRRARRFQRVTIENEVVGTCLEIIQGFEADVVAVDPAFYSGVIASLLADVPYICVHTNLCIVGPPSVVCERVEIDRVLDASRRALFGRFDVPLPQFRRCESLSPHANSLWATPSFLRGIELPRGTRCVGPSIPLGRRPDQVDFDWGQLDDRPLVFASPGTVYDPPAPFFHALAAVCDRLGLQLVVVGQRLLDRAVSGRAISVAYAPQLQMLERASVFVTHGGANSIMEGLYFGCPMLVAPLASDQPIQAHLVEQNRVGRALDPYSAGEDRIEEALRELVDPGPELAARVAELQADYRASDGAQAVAEWIAELAERRVH